MLYSTLPTKGVYRFLLSLLVIGGILSCASSSAIYGGLGDPKDQVPFMKAARTGTLPNGLSYYILENAKPENRAYLTLAVRAGSVLEEDYEQGLAHFTEHMAFKGTTRFPESELVNYLRSLGMRFGPEVNAYTSYDETVYGIEVPVELDETGHKGIPDTALAVIDDWTHAITFDPKAVDDERLVIMEEYRLHLGAMDRIRRKMLPILFQGSPYAERRPIGLPEIIEGALASTLQGFYKTWYRADNMALIFVGDFDGKALEASLASHFSMPKPDTPLKHPKPDLPGPKKRVEAEIFTDPELSFTRVDFYYKRTPKALTQDLAAYRGGIIDYLIDYMLSSRFDDAAAQPETPYLGAGGGNARYGASSRYYVLSAQAKAGNAEATIRDLLREKESMSRYGFTGPEIERAKQALISNLEQMYSEKDRQESLFYTENFTQHFLRGYLVADIDWELDAVQKLLPSIGVKELAGAVKDYFAGEDLLVFLLAPEAEGSTLPSKARIRDLVKEARNAKIPPPKAEAVTDKLLDAEPLPGTILGESTDPETRAMLWTLGNGARVILKETPNQNNEIMLYALSRGGTAGVPEGEDPSVRLASEMLNVSGIGSYSLQELQKKLTAKQVSISFWTSDFLRGFQGSSSTGDIKTFFELLYLYFTQPRMDTTAIQVMMEQYRTTLVQKKENPETFFSQEIQRTIYGNHPHFASLELGDLDKVHIEDAMRFIQKSLNPGDYTFVFTGNLNIPELRGYIKTYLASIPQGQSWNTWTNPQVTRPGKLEKGIYKGREEKSLVYMGRYIPAPYSERDAAAASGLEGYLNIRLIEEIREKLGGVYSISAGVSLSPFLPEGELRMEVYFGCDPKRVQELTAAVEQTIYRIVNEPVDPAVFNKTVEALKKGWETTIQSNRQIAASYANSAVIYGLPLSRLDARLALYQGLTPQAMQEIGRRLLQQGPIQIILYPENWKN